MTDLLPFILKSSICFAASYLFYYFILRKESSFKFNRFYLITTSILSIVIPLLRISITIPSQWFLSNHTAINESAKLDAYYVTENMPTVIETNQLEATAITTPINYSIILASIFMAISILFLIRFIFNLTRILFKVSKGEKVNFKNTTLILSNKNIQPHSFLKFIFLHLDTYKNGGINKNVFEHEKAHCDQWHSVDIIWIEFLKVFFWWNPVIWFYKKDIQLNHEYLADAAVLQQTNIIQYQQAIMSTIVAQKSMPMASHFNFNSTKKRFIMMSKMKTKKEITLLKSLLFIPVIISMLMLSTSINAQEQTPPVKKVEKKEVVKIEGKKMSEEEIKETIEKELKKLDIDEKDAAIEVIKKDSSTEISITSSKNVVIDLTENGEESVETKSFTIKVNDDENEFFVWNDEEFEVRIDDIMKDLDIQMEILDGKMKQLDEKVHIIRLKSETKQIEKLNELEQMHELKRLEHLENLEKLEEIDIKILEEINSKNQKVIKIIERKIEEANQEIERQIKVIQLDEEGLFISEDGENSVFGDEDNIKIEIITTTDKEEEVKKKKRKKKK